MTDPGSAAGKIALALCWHSLRSAFGIGRGAKAKIVPVLTFVIMCSPAVINAVIMALGRSHTRVVNYDTYVGTLRVLVLLVFMAAQAPELVARDLRSRVLPLYFARPIRRYDYPAAKYAAFVARLPRDDRHPGAAAVHRHDLAGARRRRRSGRRRGPSCPACSSA